MVCTREETDRQTDIYFLYLFYSWFTRIRININSIKPGRNKTGCNKEISSLGRVMKAATASIPSGVVQFVVLIWHFETMDDLKQNTLFIMNFKLGHKLSRSKLVAY